MKKGEKRDWKTEMERADKEKKREIMREREVMTAEERQQQWWVNPKNWDAAAAAVEIC